MLPAFRKMIQDMGPLHDVALGTLNDQKICHMQPDYNLETEPNRDSQECHCRMSEWRNPYQLDILKLRDRMVKYIGQVDRLRKVNSVDGSVKRSLARRDISRQMIWIVWLTIIWVLGPALAHVLTVSTDPASNLLPSLRVWAAVAMPLMLILLLGLRFHTA